MLNHPDDRDRIQKWLELDATFVGHNVGFDFSFLECNGYVLPDESRWHDTALIAHVAGERMPGQTALKTITRKAIKEGLLPEHLLAPEKAIKSWQKTERRRLRKQGGQLSWASCSPELSDAPARLLRPYVVNDVLLTH